MSIYIALALVWTHFVADFVLQSDKVAIAKSSDNGVLAMHVSLYTVPFFWVGLLLPLAPYIAFLLFNWVAHFVTDYISSRATTRLYKAGRRHAFFVVIGLDQAVHMTCLFASYEMVKP